jgi:hypothetical protein
MVASKEHEGGAGAEGEHEAAGLESGTDLCWGGTRARAFGPVGPGLSLGPNSASTCNLSKQI